MGAEERAKAVRHLSERRDRMRYGECRSRGLPIGSESTAIGRRREASAATCQRFAARPAAGVGGLRGQRVYGHTRFGWHHQHLC